jgi:asparaginyl-tRNA synthetase
MATRIKEILARSAAGGEVVVEGWVRTRRDSKSCSFLAVNDGSCLSSLQVVVDVDNPCHEVVRRVQTGFSVRVRGELVDSPGKGQRFEVRPVELVIIGEADPATYPLQKKRHSFEFLRSIAHLRVRGNTFGAVFRVRSALSFAIHKFFQERGFVYVHTPIITPSDCEGAGEMFRVTTLDLADPPRVEGKVDFREDFFGRETFLTVSGQLSAEALALGLGNVYTFGPTFRAENSNTSRHLAEFWMIEPEMAFCDLEGCMDLAEEFLREIIAYVLEHCSEDMAFFDRWIERGVIDKLRGVVESSFLRLSYTEAIKVLEQAKEPFEFPVFWGCDLQSEHERYLTEKRFRRPVIIHDYPDEIKAFYMRLNDDGRTVAAMDALVPGIGEIIGGSQREERLEVLRERIRAKGLPEDQYWWYLDLRRFGTAPHAGFGLGFERMVMYVSGMANIRDVIPFARTPGNAEF